MDAAGIEKQLRAALALKKFKGEFLSSDLIAEMLGIQRKVLERATKKNLLHPLRLSGSHKGRLRYSLTEIVRWLAKNDELASLDQTSNPPKPKKSAK